MVSREGNEMSLGSHSVSDAAMSLLVEAGAVLATSLDMRTTMGQVAQLTVPELADLCTIDLLDSDGSITEAAVAAADPKIAASLEELRDRHPLDPQGEHPVACVIRSGEPELQPLLNDELLRSFAQSTAHARFMISHRYRSAAVAPLLARGRTLGALSVLRLGDAAPYDEHDMALVSELARRAALAIDNARLFSDLKRAELAEAFLADVGRVLASSMDFAETLRRVAQLAVSQLGDLCAVHMIDDAGQLSCVAVHHSDPDKAAIAERLASSYTPQLPERRGVAEVIRSGRASISTEISAETLAAHARDEEQLELLRAIGAHAAIIVPMLTTSKAIGALTFISSNPSRRLTKADLPVAEELGRRAGTAVENARLYTERTRIAHTLQQALLPDSLPQLPDVEIEARYSPAGELNEVGGDFYDVFECEQDRWMLVIGDVCGKGPEAASVTALARHTLRAAAMSGQEPLAMLRLLHRELRKRPAGADLCTVCLVSVTPLREGVQVGVALAGHPQPLRVTCNGEVMRLGDPGTLLGVIDPIEVKESFAELLPGETLLLYTDGVAEGGRPSGALSEQGLIELCRAAPSLPLPSLLQGIEQAALTHTTGLRRDDIALLALRPRAR